MFEFCVVAWAVGCGHSISCYCRMAHTKACLCQTSIRRNVQTTCSRLPHEVMNSCSNVKNCSDAASPVAKHTSQQSALSAESICSSCLAVHTVNTSSQSSPVITEASDMITGTRACYKHPNCMSKVSTRIPSTLAIHHRRTPIHQRLYRQLPFPRLSFVCCCTMQAFAALLSHALQVLTCYWGNIYPGA